METLYGQVMLRMPVRIIYAHTLIARLADGRIVAEVNPDIYGRGGDPLQLLRDMAYKEDLEAAIDWTVAARVAKARIGQAHEIGRADAESSRAGAAKGHELAVSRIGDWSAGCERGAR
jgi:hypothetical protein